VHMGILLTRKPNCRLLQQTTTIAAGNRARRHAPCGFWWRLLESERSPNREKAVRGVHWSPKRLPVTFLFSVGMPVSHSYFLNGMEEVKGSNPFRSTKYFTIKNLGSTH